MFDPSPTPRVFALPPGEDFPKALVEGIIARMKGQPPDAMARLTIYLNTSRMLRRVRAVFEGFGPLFVPRLRLVTDIGRDPLADLPPAIPTIRRRLELAELVSWLLARESGFSSRSAMFDLADSLAGLMAEMQDEGVLPSALDLPGLADNHAVHWQHSLKFIRIVARYFEAGVTPDAEARQRILVETLARKWSDTPPTDPVIVAGSTGSRGTTALFMQSVARLPYGAVVLPGFDFDMPDFAWNSLVSGGVPAEDHPQFRFLNLVRSLDLPRSAIQPWAGVGSPDVTRGKLLSLALRPAPVTDQWMAEGQKMGPLDIATAGISLIEAPNPQVEALAIALCLHEAAVSGTRAALVSPDRILTRRVEAALDRWSIVPDDSAGEPLSQTAPGRLLRHIAELMASMPAAEAILTLLKHPLTATGSGDRGNHLRFTRDLELKIRRKGPAFLRGSDILVWSITGNDPHRAVWGSWLAHILDTCAGMSEGALETYVTTHLSLAETIAAGPDGRGEDSELWRQEAGRTAFATMSELQRESGQGGTFNASDYALLVASVLRDGTVRRIRETHPLIAVWGTLEARVQGAELVILAGLNEGIWPKTPAPDPWLSRQMRRDIGLLSPERQIGLSAHDFQQAANAPRVVLSRSLRDDEAQTVASRWLARLTNLLRGLPEQKGAAALAAMRKRGDDWLDMAARIAAPTPAQKAAITAAHRPAPRPPVCVRPTELPVTGIRTLIRDPYAIYARYILGLRPLNPLQAVPDARLRGQVLHKIVEFFIRDRPAEESIEAARARLMQLSEKILSEEIPWPSAQRIWLARLDRVASSFLTSEAHRQGRGAPIVLEKSGSVMLESGIFELTARPDRIDLLDDGRVHIYDYKTGEPPSGKQMAFFEKQLLLEAAMAERGGFPELGPRQVEAVTYIQLGGKGKEPQTDVDTQMLNQIWAELHLLIGSYQRRETGYPSRRAVFKAGTQGDYDHLARYGEWQMSDFPEAEDVG